MPQLPQARCERWEKEAAATNAGAAQLEEQVDDGDDGGDDGDGDYDDYNDCDDQLRSRLLS